MDQDHGTLSRSTGSDEGAGQVQAVESAKGCGSALDRHMGSCRLPSWLGTAIFTEVIGMCLRDHRRQGREPVRGLMADNRHMAGSDVARDDGAGRVEAAAAAAGKPRARDLNELIRYTMWSVFRVRGPGALEDVARGVQAHSDGTVRAPRDILAGELEDLREQASRKSVVTRGCYDVQGLRADADYMFWWIASAPESLAAWSTFSRPL